jgi:hypothetical protein
VLTVSTLAREPMIPAIPHMPEVYATRRSPARAAARPPAPRATQTVAICRRFV